MRIAIIGNDLQQMAFAGISTKGSISIDAISNIEMLSNTYDAIFDYCYTEDSVRNSILEKFAPILFINNVEHTLNNTAINYIRFNGWPTFAEKAPLEIATITSCTANYKAVLDALQITYIQVANTIGLVTPRVVSMLINEAYFALEDGVSTKGEIDTAMQLGTNYPYGPFDWVGKIGINRVVALLKELSKEDATYVVANLLNEENITTT